MRFLEAKNMKEMIGIRSQLDAILQSNFFRTTFLELDGVLWQFWDDNIDLG